MDNVERDPVDVMFIRTKDDVAEFAAVDTVTRLWSQAIGLSVPEFRQGYLAPIYEALQRRAEEPRRSRRDP